MTSPTGSAAPLPDWARAAAKELEDLGFLLLDPDRPGAVPGPRLVVALRDRPTLAHFDPEYVSYWVLHEGRGTRVSFDRDSPVPFEEPFSWGHLHVVDRIPVHNRFLSFGGTFRAAAVDPRLTVLEFSSPAPMARWAGHSQGTDSFGTAMGAFFARLRLPVDYQPDAERRIGEASPTALYAAFLHQMSTLLHRGHDALAAARPRLTPFVDHERARIRRDDPEAWGQGVALLEWLEIID